MQCQVELGEPDFELRSFQGSSHRVPIRYDADVLEGGQAKITCRNGHKTNFVIQAVKPEILSAIAGYAIVDGYYREAVTSFTAALERLYELYVHVVAKSKDVDQTEFENAWKLMSRQSERQYGAFAMLYLFEEGVAPKHLNSNKIAFRNNVVHKGIIPTKEKAIEYGKIVLEIMHEVALVFREKYSKSLSQIVLNRMRNVSTQRADEEYNAMMAPAFIVDIQGLNADPSEPDLDNWLVRESRYLRY